MEADEQAEEARRAKEAGNDAYRKSFLETAVNHYTRGALLDPGDISFLTNRAAAYLKLCKYKECVRDCDVAVSRGRELGADNKLIAKALSRKASALLELADCAGDYAPAIRALEQSLTEHYCEETLDKLGKTESERKELEEQERLDQEAADHDREKGNEFFKQKKYHEAAMHYTRAMKMNPKDPRAFSNRAQCHIYLGYFPQGLEDAEKCVELDPTFLKGYVRKAKVQFLMESYENALATYLEGLKCDPNNMEVLDGLRRCAACIKRANGGDVELVDLKEMLGNFQSENDLRKFQKATEQAAILKKEASDERLRRIESERMARTMEEHLSGVQQELERLKKQHSEVMEKLQKTNENLQGQLSASRGQYERLLSEHDHLLHERNHAVREVQELRQKRDQMLSVLTTAMHSEFSSSELERATENFSSSLKIGEGGFGCVYRGILRNMIVAIKVLKPESLQGQSQFEQEVSILSRVRHPHLVTLLGACSDSSTLVYEFLPNGSLEDFLVCAEKRCTLQWQTRIRIIAEICAALVFLHKNKPHPVVHGDLKPANILLDVNLVSKLSDFGISRHLIQSSKNNTIMYHTMHPMGTPLYMDPEFFATGELTCQSDVYSFGVVVLRLLTGKPPDRIKNIVEDAMQKGDLNSVVDNSAGEWPEVHAQQLAYLAINCMERSRRCRPDLSGEVWGMVEAMRDDAALSSASSSRPVSGEICTPPYFICPISQDIMNDPHIAADGFTYEAEDIRSWFDRGHDTSPMTNMRLEHDELIPNRALRSAIQEWLQQHNMAV
ncbi:U-box domain-containing protein 33 [Dichanthelium oligosanthes]|uniref:RING-type E3 ubiquitin transferase n=1 Tax=Dichanthelium oligosanthes TaxID=888268 RepID=A0A1E5W2B3_9POAL|nr:U-box domain-containing protein 33 [Dichanthelium oligosanthes]